MPCLLPSSAALTLALSCCPEKGFARKLSADGSLPSSRASAVYPDM